MEPRPLRRAVVYNGPIFAYSVEPEKPTIPNPKPLNREQIL